MAGGERVHALCRTRRQLQLLHQQHRILQPSAGGTDRSILPQDTWSFSADYMYYHSNGDVQTPGWNRLTQALIDNGTYITGRNTSLTASNGKYLTFNDLGGNPYTFDPNFHALACAGCQDAAHMLNTGVGTTTLSTRTVYIAKGVDFSNTITHTAFVMRAADDQRVAARPCGFGCSATCCRMTVSCPMAFPVPTAPRSASASRDDLQVYYRAAENLDRGGLSRRNARTCHRQGKASTVAFIALDRRDDLLRPPRPTTLWIRPSIPIRRVPIPWSGKTMSTATQPMPAPSSPET